MSKDIMADSWLFEICFLPFNGLSFFSAFRAACSLAFFNCSAQAANRRSAEVRSAKFGRAPLFDCRGKPWERERERPTLISFWGSLCIFELEIPFKFSISEPTNHVAFTDIQKTSEHKDLPIKLYHSNLSQVAVDESSEMVSTLAALAGLSSSSSSSGKSSSGCFSLGLKSLGTTKMSKAKPNYRRTRPLVFFELGHPEFGEDCNSQTYVRFVFYTKGFRVSSGVWLVNQCNSTTKTVRGCMAFSWWIASLKIVTPVLSNRVRQNLQGRTPPPPTTTWETNTFKDQRSHTRINITRHI